MGITLNFSSHKKSVQLSEKELHDLNNAIAFALSNSSISSRKFGAIHVETDGRTTAFSQKQTSAKNSVENTIVTDC